MVEVAVQDLFGSGGITNDEVDGMTGVRIGGRTESEGLTQGLEGGEAEG